MFSAILFTEQGNSWPVFVHVVEVEWSGRLNTSLVVHFAHVSCLLSRLEPWDLTKRMWHPICKSIFQKIVRLRTCNLPPTFVSRTWFLNNSYNFEQVSFSKKLFFSPIFFKFPFLAFLDVSCHCEYMYFSDSGKKFHPPPNFFSMDIFF